MIDWSRDGKQFLVAVNQTTDGETKLTNQRLAWLPVAGGERAFITPADRPAYNCRLSPDGTRVLYHSPDPQAANAEPPRWPLHILTLADGKSVRVADTVGGWVFGHVWSSDGRWVAYAVLHEPPGDPPVGQVSDWEVIVCRSDGGDRKTILTGKLTRNDRRNLDWRVHLYNWAPSVDLPKK